MLAFPDIQAKVQEELDRVVGRLVTVSCMNIMCSVNMIHVLYPVFSLLEYKHADKLICFIHLCNLVLYPRECVVGSTKLHVI